MERETDEQMLDRHVRNARAMFDTAVQGTRLNHAEEGLLRSLLGVVEAARESGDVEASATALIMLRKRA